MIMSSTPYVDLIDPERKMKLHADSNSELLLTNMAAFDFMMDSPAQYEVANPDVTLEDIVQPHESFYRLGKRTDGARWLVVSAQSRPQPAPLELESTSCSQPTVCVVFPFCS